MDRSNLQHILFALGKALQDLYIAEKSGGGSEFNELQKRVKEGLQILRFLGIGLEAEMIFDIEADGGAEHLFVAAADWTGSEDESVEPDYTAELKVGIVILKQEGKETIERGDVTVVVVSEPDFGGNDFEGLSPDKNQPLPMPNEPLTAADWKFLWELGAVAPLAKRGEEALNLLNPHAVKDAAIAFALNLQSCYIEENLGEKRKAAIFRKNANDIMDFLHSSGIQVNVTVQNVYPRGDGCNNKIEIQSFWPPEDDQETKFYLCIDANLVISEGGKKITPGDIDVILRRAYANRGSGEPGEGPEGKVKNSPFTSYEESRKLYRSIFGTDPPTGEPK